jgi:hypothetical protein
MWYSIAADLVVIVHLLFIGFVVGGVFLAWRWPRVVWVHVPAVAYGALVEFVGFSCPLTLLENVLRRRAGDAGYRGGFIEHYLGRVIYPPGLTRGMQIGLGMLVLLVAAAGYGGFLRRPAPGRTSRKHGRGHGDERGHGDGDQRADEQGDERAGARPLGAADQGRKRAVPP